MLERPFSGNPDALSHPIAPAKAVWSDHLSLRQQYGYISCKCFADVEDDCPRNRVQADGAPTLIKCCLLEDHIEVDQQCAVVPWGATLQHIQAALHALTATEPLPTQVNDEL